MKYAQILVMLCLLSLLGTVQGQAQPDADYWDKKKVDEDAEAEEVDEEEEPVYNVHRITNDNWKDIIMIGRDAHLFILFQELECRECRRGATELAKLANITMDEPKVGRVDCTMNENLCQILRKGNGSHPYMLYIKNNSVFHYGGKIDAEEIDRYIKEEQWNDNQQKIEDFV